MHLIITLFKMYIGYSYSTHPKKAAFKEKPRMSSTSGLRHA